MDTTDFGYFYGYAWRILQGQIPYRDFFYIKPALPLYWHALWLGITPFEWQVLAGKAGFCLSMLAASWLGSLYLSRIINLPRLRLNLPLLATGAFVFSIHSFPHMPWHTADGVLFSAGALFCAFSAWPVAGGILAAAAILCKQSFILVPVGIAIALHAYGKPVRRFVCAALGSCLLWLLWLYCNDAWRDFISMTTGQLTLREAFEAAIGIYLTQNWLLPMASLLPWLIFYFLRRPLPLALSPACCYLLCLTVWYIGNVFTQQTWIGYGASWPTLFLCLGAAAVVRPDFFLCPYATTGMRWSLACGFGCALLVAWSAAISGGYKIPAFFAAPLLLAFYIWHARFFRPAACMAWLTLVCGLIIFGAGWIYPYTFPIRPLSKSAMIYNAGDIYPQATGVRVDKDMYERLAELKELRSRYGANYKTLPGFSMSYYLNGDAPVIASDWLIDWEINGQVEELFQQLERENVTVFMERDQLDASQADSYARAGYGVPQLVRHKWKIVEETPHFVIFQKP